MFNFEMLISGYIFIGKYARIRRAGVIGRGQRKTWRRYSFTPPASIPATNCFCSAKKTASTTVSDTSVAAMS